MTIGLRWALWEDGTLWAWGHNDVGQLGDGTTTSRTTPVRVGSLQSVVAVSGGRDRGLAVLANGEVWAWGDNRFGQVGDGTTIDRTSPRRSGQLANAVAVVGGAHHSLALLADGSVRSWGRNYRGQLGDGTTTQRTAPVVVQGIDSAESIGGGRDHGMAVLADGSVRAWGHNNGGELGDGTTSQRTSPVTVADLVDAELVGGGSDYSVALVTEATDPDNTPPRAHDLSVTTDEDEPVAVTLSGDDPDGDPLTFQVTSGPSHGSLTGAGVNRTWVPDPDFAGTDSFTYVARDASTTSPPAIVTLTALPVNDAPIALDQSVTTTPGTPVAVSLVGEDVDGDPLTARVVSGPDDGMLDGAGSERTYVPDAGFVGTDHVTFAVDDGTVESAIATVTISVIEGGGVDPIAFVGSDVQEGNRSSFAVQVPNQVRAGHLLVLFLSVNQATVAAAPPLGADGWSQLGSATSGSMRTTIWTRVAGPGTTRTAWPGGGDQPVVAEVLSAQADKATMATVVLRPADTGPPAPQAPVASFTVDCTARTCFVDGSESSDPDGGGIQSWSWDFGGDAIASGPTASHTFSADGTWDVTLIVVDDEGEAGQATSTVTIDADWPAEPIVFMGADVDEGNRSSFSVQVPSSLEGGEVLVLFLSVNRSDVSVGPVTGVSGWAEPAVIESSSMQTAVWTRVAGPGDAGGTATVTLGGRAKGILALAAYGGTDPTDPVVTSAMVEETVARADRTTPVVSSDADGAWVVSYWSDKTSATSGWSPPAGQNVRVAATGGGAGRITALLTDGGPVGPGDQGGLTATADSSNQKATMVTLVLRPAPG